MKSIIKYFCIAALTLSASGCSDYLDVVPDKTQEVGLLFNRKEAAYRALATCYHYLPKYDNTYGLLGATDEMSMKLSRVTDGKNLLLGKQSADNPIMSYWKGDTGSSWAEYAPCEASMFTAIRVCNTFLENINTVPDMTQSEISQWSAEVRFLKAYYHFLLFSQYGAIPIIRENAPIDATGDALYPKREPINVVIDYITSEMDAAAAALPARITNATSLGRIDGLIAKSMKARVLLYAASPLFNNNSMFANVANKDGEKLFPMGDANSEHEKWVQAAEAYKTAIEEAESNGLKLYTYEPTLLASSAIDGENYAKNPKLLQAMYNYQYATVDKWNTELVWGYSNVSTDWHEIQRSINYKDKNESSTGDAWQWNGATLVAAEEFYTKNGLPINEDPEFDYEHRDDLVTIPAEYSAVAQEGETTVKLHLDREPRFYASLGFDRSRVRGYGKLYDLKMRYQEDNGAKTAADIDVPSCGYFMRKLMHPDTDGKGNIVRYAWPIIRLNEMYLAYAECLNEAYGVEKQAEVLSLLNKIRERDGIPTVQESWAKAKDKDLYKTQEGMRKIIKQERTAELAFEGYRFDDCRRWLDGDVFNQHIYTWNTTETEPEKYYQRIEDPQMLHVFTSRNYLFPIPTNELVSNTNLVQNPGY